MRRPLYFLALGLCLVAGACSSASQRADSGGGAEDLEPFVQDYLDSPTSDQAQVLIAEIEGLGSVDQTPYLVDFVRTSGSSRVQQDAVSALVTIRSANDDSMESKNLDLNGAYVEHGSWVLAQQPQPSPSYQAFKAQVYGALDGPFSALLADVSDIDQLVGIQWGGVPVGGIVELNDPERIDVSEADWVNAEETVFVVDGGGETLAYPLRILGKHELANDTLLDEAGVKSPIGVSYCSLCRTAVAFNRIVDGQELSFKTSGLLLDSNKLMLDDQTNSLWQQATGLAISGPLAGSRLQLLPVRAVAAGQFQAEGASTIVDLPKPFITDPETGALTGYAYVDEEPLPDYLVAGRLWFPVSGSNNLVEPLATVATAIIDDRAMAVDPVALEAEQATVLSVGDSEVLVVSSPPAARFFNVTALDSDELELLTRLVVDRHTGLTNLQSGQVRDLELESSREAWFSWLSRNPDTVLWPKQ